MQLSKLSFAGSPDPRSMPAHGALGNTQGASAEEIKKYLETIMPSKQETEAASEIPKPSVEGSTKLDIPA